MRKRIIISGGGIAGLSAAKLLAEQGHEIVVVDKASQFNNAGFLVSLKSFGVRIMEEMGLVDNLIKESTSSEFMHWLDSNGDMIRDVSYKTVNQNTSQSILITRGGLHHVIYEHVKHDVKIIFGKTIADLQQDGKIVHVKLSDGQEMDADLVVVSEGLRSSTRTKYFTESRLEDFNLLYMGGRLKEKHPYKVGTIRTYLDVNKMLSVYPVNNEEVAIQCYIYSTGDIADIHSNANQLLRKTFKNYNSEVQHLIEEFIKEGLMFVDKMGMVEAPNLVEGNVVLLGDAGYCPTALSGMGASLSIYGAKALSHFLAQSPDNLAISLDRYNELMQPIRKKFQENARNNAKSFIPKNEADLIRFGSLFKNASDEEVSKMMTEQLILTEDQLNFTIK
ncbi:FAD-dependent monooxygenase [Chitinophaga sp. RCC_12]|uniref:FAD-dependent monooxygenase n=1 Tax=Chitinophaga sp. RCC_12 TaxID=3239226 RepID=UPI003523DE48